MSGALQERYELLGLMGQGAFGQVHRARQRATGQEVAIKLLRPLEGASARTLEKQAARFRREMRLCAQLYHPNIVRLIDSGEAALGALYAVFEWVPGQNLGELLAAEGALAPAEAVHLMLQVLDALACAHAAGVVHRDVKPQNIMVTRTGARRNAQVLDFGLGALAEGHRRQDTRISSLNEILGTPAYAAPEQLRGEPPSPRSDLYAWALVLIECLTGQRVMAGQALEEVLYRQLGPDPVPLPESLRGTALGELLRRATVKEVHQRDVTAAGLLRELEDCAPRAERRKEEAPPPIPAAPPEEELRGRAEELEHLRQRWARAERGDGQCLLIVGEPGAGKSRLVLEWVRQLWSHPVTLLEYRCTPEAQGRALAPAAAMLERVLRGLHGTAPALPALEALLARNGLELEEAVPVLAPLLGISLEPRYVPPEGTPGWRTTLTLNALLALVLGMSGRQPLLLVVEDLQWTDPSTLEWLTLVVDEAPRARLCALLTARPGFDAPWPADQVPRLLLAPPA